MGSGGGTGVPAAASPQVVPAGSLGWGGAGRLYRVGLFRALGTEQGARRKQRERNWVRKTGKCDFNRKVSILLSGRGEKYNSAIT